MPGSLPGPLKSMLINIGNSLLRCIILLQSPVTSQQIVYLAVGISYKYLLRPFNRLFSRATWVCRYQKGKTSLDLNKAKDDMVLGFIGIN